LYFVVHVRCRRKESSRSLSHIFWWVSCQMLSQSEVPPDAIATRRAHSASPRSQIRNWILWLYAAAEKGRDHRWIRVYPTFGGKWRQCNSCYLLIVPVRAESGPSGRVDGLGRIARRRRRVDVCVRARFWLKSETAQHMSYSLSAAWTRPT